MTQFILTDIEGTTTEIDFVHNILFTYSREKLVDYVTTHQDKPEIQEAIRLVKATLREEARHLDANLQECLQALQEWIQKDKKHPGLKAIQGHVWQAGYLKGDFMGHVYPDVRPMLEHWQKAGFSLAVYSSGSVKAQKLLFGYSIEGDLAKLFSHFFDTAVGAKKEASSYLAILRELQVKEPSDVLFLSDTVDELKAAQLAGMRTALLDRTQKYTGRTLGGIPLAKDFREIDQLIATDYWL